MPPSTAGAAPGGSNPLAIGTLRSSAARDPRAAIKDAAKQFEALFMQQLMKSMRDATVSSGMLENSGTKLGTEMLDTQFAAQMTGMPRGLSDVIARQLERQMGGAVANAATKEASAVPSLPQRLAPASADSASSAPSGSKQSEFVRMHENAARAAELQTGIPATFMVAQAAHESGWGRREIKNADGSTSHNLFGIKAGAGWNGKVATITTTEYVNGAPQKVTAKFRAYGSYEESFADYARMLKDSPRYSGVVARVAGAGADAASAQTFAKGLQRAGYATDPAYADKLARVINTTLRMQRAAA
nr:flagellar assembly peptidoglycan hydrolase FlgJ [Schlegelella koreensis]